VCVCSDHFFVLMTIIDNIFGLPCFSFYFIINCDQKSNK